MVGLNVLFGIDGVCEIVGKEVLFFCMVTFLLVIFVLLVVDTCIHLKAYSCNRVTIEFQDPWFPLFFLVMCL